MKNLTFILGLGFLIILGSCKDEVPVDYVILSGKVTNSPSQEISINSLDLNIERSNQPDFQRSITLNHDGSFRDTLKIETGAYLLYDGKNSARIYLDVETDITVNFDANDFKNTLTFSGHGSEINTYYLAKEQKGLEVELIDMQALGLDETEFQSKFNENKKTIQTLLSTYTNIPENLKAKELRNSQYYYLQHLPMYEAVHPSLKDGKPDPTFKTSEGFLRPLDDISYEREEDYLYSDSYRRLLTMHYQQKAQEFAASDSILLELAELKSYAGITNDKIKNSLILEKAQRGITFTNDIDGYYKAFMVASSDDNHKAKITEIYNNLKAISKGQLSPKFMNYKNHAGGTTSLDDLKGKFVYIDVWATWCGPCKAQIPFLKKVEKSYHGKNIEFVSLTIDVAKDYEKWQKMVVDMELGGIQLFADKDWASQFIKDYQIKGIPRFILIDPDGNIVSSNAPRPSDPKLIDLFNENNI